MPPWIDFGPTVRGEFLATLLAVLLAFWLDSWFHASGRAKQRAEREAESKSLLALLSDSVAFNLAQLGYLQSESDTRRLYLSSTVLHIDTWEATRIRLSEVCRDTQALADYSMFFHYVRQLQDILRNLETMGTPNHREDWNNYVRTAIKGARDLGIPLLQRFGSEPNKRTHVPGYADAHP